MDRGQSTPSYPNPLKFDMARLREELPPWRLHWYPRLRSTSDTAAELRRDGQLFAPAIVIAGSQTAGRGRNNAPWFAGPGGLAATFAVPAVEIHQPGQLALIAGVATLRAMRALGAEHVKLKWPNDLHHDGLKLAGLLCERIDGVDLIGIGLNLERAIDWTPEVEATSTTLGAILHRPADKAEVLLALATSLHKHLVDPALRLADVLGEFRRHDALAGQHLRLATPAGDVAGDYEGMDAAGRLLLRDAAGQTTAHASAAVESVRPA
jgi:BirA family biotin operon repressor/biotin-[acetyl-CoA-carboxylase] ligase